MNDVLRDATESTMVVIAAAVAFFYAVIYPDKQTSLGMKLCVAFWRTVGVGLALVGLLAIRRALWP